MQNKTTHTFSQGTFTVLDKDVVLFNYKKGEKITLRTMSESNEMRKEVMGDIPYYTIIDTSEGLPSFTGDAKSWIAINKEAGEARIMDIAIVDSWVARIAARSYMMLFKPRTKTVIVESFDEAMKSIEKERTRVADSISLAG